MKDIKIEIGDNDSNDWSDEKLAKVKAFVKRESSKRKIKLIQERIFLIEKIKKIPGNKTKKIIILLTKLILRIEDLTWLTIEEDEEKKLIETVILNSTDLYHHLTSPEIKNQETLQESIELLEEIIEDLKYCFIISKIPRL